MNEHGFVYMLLCFIRLMVSPAVHMPLDKGNSKKHLTLGVLAPHTAMYLVGASIIGSIIQCIARDVDKCVLLKSCCAMLFLINRINAVGLAMCEYSQRKPKDCWGGPNWSMIGL